MDIRRLAVSARRFAIKMLESDAPTMYLAWRRLMMPVRVVCSALIFIDMSLHGRMLAAIVLIVALWVYQYLEYRYIMFWWRIRQRWRRRWDS